MRDFHIAADFDGDTLPPIPYPDALHRVQAYCTDREEGKGTGWLSYDLAAADARRSGAFETVAMSSLLWGNALAGRVDVGDIEGFTTERRSEFAHRVGQIPNTVSLDKIDDKGLEAVAHLCQYGWPGVRAAKITKVGALYRPASVPVLDRNVSFAFGFKSEGFSGAEKSGRDRIRDTVKGIAKALRANADLLKRVRADAADLVPDLQVISDLRLLDIIIWTSQDDRMSRDTKPTNEWLDSDLRGRAPITREQVTPIAIAVDQ